MLQDLYVLLKELFTMVVYWKEYNEDLPSFNYSLHSSISLIETIMDEVKNGPPPVDALSTGDVLTNDQLKMTIRHFMKLFDVRKESGVYTRIHNIYVRYYELANAFRSIQQILHVGKKSLTTLFFYKNNEAQNGQTIRTI